MKTRQEATTLVFRFGQLGDSLIAMPVIEAIRRKYHNHRLVLLTDKHPDKNSYVSSWAVLGPTEWFDDVIFYNPAVKKREKLKSIAKITKELRSLNIVNLYNLAPERSALQALRDKFFFKLIANPNTYYSCDPYIPPAAINGILPRVEPEWHLLMRIDSFDKSPDKYFRLTVPPHDKESALNVFGSIHQNNASVCIAIGPGSKMSSKRWPKENYLELGSRLLANNKIHLLVLGGMEDERLGNELCNAWGKRSFNLAGKLSIYESAAVLDLCDAYIGNDTGVMHLAAMVGKPCVAVFSARDYPGKWEPYGSQHVNLRHTIECEGCMLESCNKYNKCLENILVNEVLEAAKSVINLSISWDT